jgi:hypothetical protein
MDYVNDLPWFIKSVRKLLWVQKVAHSNVQLETSSVEITTQL